MTEKELYARYKNTVLGFFWLVIIPLLQMFIIGFVYTYFIRQSMEHFLLFLYIGLLAWNFFSASLSKATSSIVSERSLIKCAVFPREIIPLSIILSNFTHVGLALLLYAIPVYFAGTFTLQSLILLLPAVLWLVVNAVGFSLLCSALNVRHRDVNFLIQALLLVWFYATPILYPLSVIPQQFRWIWSLNPMTAVVTLLQHVFLNTGLPTGVILITNTAITTLVLLVGLYSFRRECRYFDDYL